MQHNYRTHFSHLLLFLICIFLPYFIQSQTHKVSGYIKDYATKEPIIGATIYLSDRSKGTISDIEGKYSLNLQEGQANLVVSFIGYENSKLTATIKEDTTLNFYLKQTQILTPEVQVYAEAKDKNVTEISSGTITLRSKEIKLLPPIMGEADPVKALTLTAGVSQSEGSGGFTVRGSGHDQNLVLINNAIIFNSSHLLGIYSVFNADAIQNIKFIKSGIPAQYGGRLSSVLDVNTFGGNYNKNKFNGNIGLLSSNLTFSAPLQTDKVWFSISGRRTYIDEVLSPIVKKVIPAGALQDQTTKYGFGDLNGKIEWKANNNNRFGFSIYTGNDAFTFDNNRNAQADIDWGNDAICFLWKHKFSDSLKMKTTVNWSKYEFNFNASQEYYDMLLKTKVENIKANSDITIKNNAHSTTQTGIELIKYTLTPNDIKVYLKNSPLNFGTPQDQHALELSAYITKQKKITSRLKAEAGVRLGSFSHIGPYDRITNTLLSSDTISYKPFEPIKTYIQISPRISMRYILSPTSSIKGAFSRSFQNLHHATLSSSSLPSDVWTPSSTNIKPMRSTQTSAGYFKNIFDDKIECSGNLYYKYMHNVADMDDDISSLSKSAHIEDNMLFGEGYSYGLETMIKKSRGKMRFSLAYTLSTAQFILKQENETIQYNSDYNRPHDMTAFASYQLNDRLNISLLFTLASGKPITLPSARYFIEGNIVNVYTNKNEFSMPTYHRLDVSAKYQLHSKRENFSSSLLFSVYNAYNKQNPYFIYFETTGDLSEYSVEVKTKQVSMFPILPSISWVFNIN